MVLLRPRFDVLLALLSLIAVAGCGDDAGAPGPVSGPVSESSARTQVSTRLCYAYRSCDCGTLLGVSLSNCDLGMGFAWDARVDQALEQGLTYDGDCLARRLNAMLERGCTVTSQGGNFPGCTGETCLIYHGEVAEGGDCDGGLSSSNCQQGLVCMGTCQKPCAGVPLPLGEGERCVQDGTPTGTCGLGLACDLTTELCAAPGIDGAPCVSGQCADGHWCDPTSGSGVCKRQLGAGEACIVPQECQSIACTDSVCDALPGEGEPCPYGRCAGDLGCVTDGSAMVCARLPGKGEACPGYRCAEGLVCGAKSCSMSPSAPGCDQCQGDSCVVQVCMEEPPAVCGDSGGLLY